MKPDVRDSARYEKFSRRAAILSLGTLGVFGGLAARLYGLQVVSSNQFKELAEANRINRRILPPQRGRVFDRFGVELAVNRQNLQVQLIPEGISDLEGTLDQVGKFIELSDARRARILKDISRRKRFLPVTLAENLTWEEFARINAYAPKLPGIQPNAGELRFYPYADRLAHVLGYVAKPSETDVQDNDGDPLLMVPGFRIGKSGLERTFDEELRGKAGTKHVVVNAVGREIKEHSREDGEPGKEAVLTLDMGLQSFAYDQLKGESGGIVVMDVTNGDVLAIAQNPAFDPNEFTTGLSQESWDALRTNEMNPLVNKALQGQYAPGSTFKIVTALAALESGLIDPNEHFYCNGKTRLGRREFHCWKKEGHGSMNLRNGLKNSCNVYFFEVARKIGMEPIAAMAERFGLGAVHDFGIPGGKAGLVPTEGWKQAVQGGRWSTGDTFNCSIGQGYLLTTPIQLAVMVSRLASGGRQVEPRILRALGDDFLGQGEPFGDMGLNPKWVDLVKQGVIAVVNEPGGTAFGKRLTGPGLSMAGKTGTVQVRRISKEERASGVIKNEDLAWKYRDHGWFVGFGPIENPRYAVAVLIEHGGGGSSAAAPVAKEVMREVLLRNPSIRPSYGPKGEASVSVSGMPGSGSGAS
ncbi:MAG: penicillin-binding protein 2 [Alphaproteobacteria bacterium]|nr:MAG: penicillin-binding protein 2 [Alphaproteobacteria bacterium]